MSEPIFRRSDQNPILTAEDLPVPASAVLNPGAVEQDGGITLLLRVEDTTGYSNIHVARSKNGVDNWSIEEKPLLQYGLPEMRYEQWGCEDPRVVWLDEEQRFYITYTAFSPSGGAVGLACSKDLDTAHRIGLIFPPNNKDSALFPCKFGDRWAALHRPDAGGGIENIWIAYSKDLIYWGEPHSVLEEKQGPAWDGVTVGAGPPPLLTDKGWLLLYHGVKVYGGQRVYRAGAALLERDNPYKIVARSPSAIFKPTEVYEQSGLMSNVVFPSGLVLRGEQLWMYYGAADTCIGLAVANLRDVLNELE